MVYRRIKPLLRKKLYEIEKIREIHIKISRFIVTFAYEEFFEGCDQALEDSKGAGRIGLTRIFVCGCKGMHFY